MSEHEPTTLRIEGRKHSYTLKSWSLFAASAVTTLTLVGMILTGMMAFGDDRWAKTDDLENVKENVEFMTTVILEDKIAELNYRIESLESRFATLDDESKRNLYSLRIKRNKYQEHLRKIAEE